MYDFEFENMRSIKKDTVFEIIYKYKQKDVKKTDNFKKMNK